MLEKFIKKFERCKNCRKFLKDGSKHIGFCNECAPKEIVRLKKRIMISAIAGAVIMVIALAAVRHAQTTAFAADAGFLGRNTIFVPFFSGHLVFNARSFNEILNFTLKEYAILAAICFLMPFGAYVRLGDDSNRVKAETNAVMSDALAGSLVTRSKAHRVEGSGLFIFELVLMAISGPFFFLYRPFRIKQLEKYIS